MLQLTIGGLPAVLKAGTSIKLTRENPFFSDAGDYTLEVTLPLDGCKENQRIFGAAHRPELTMAAMIDARLPFNLLAPPLQLDGYATVKSVTQEEVKVQLTASGTDDDYTKDTDGNDIYIDSLDLGYAFDDLLGTDENTTEQEFLHAYMASPQAMYSYDIRFMPIYSRADDAWANKQVFMLRLNRRPNGLDENNQMTWRYEYATSGQHTWPADPARTLPLDAHGNADFTNADFADDVALAVQPSLLFALSRVCAALGYEADTLQISPNPLDWQRQVVIASPRRTLRIAGALPHWTVEEFLRQVRQFFGCKIFKEGRTLVFRHRDFATAGQTFLKEVADETQAEFDAEAQQTDTSAGNVAYAFATEVHDALCLPDEVWERAAVYECADYDAVVALYDVLTQEKRKHAILHDAETNRHYAVRELHGQRTRLFEVDHYGTLVRRTDTRQADVELRIVPASMDVVPADAQTWARLCNEAGTQDDYILHDESSYADDVTADVTAIVTDASRADDAGSIDIWQHLVDEEEQAADKPDAMEVYLYVGSQNLNVNIPATAIHVDTGPNSTDANVAVSFPLLEGIIFGFTESGATAPLPGFAADYVPSFSLKRTGNTVGSQALRMRQQCDTRLQRTVRFTDPYIPPLSDMIIVRGKPYAMAKLELAIDADGLQPLKTATLYELQI